MSEVTDLRNVTKFNGQNFQLWKFQMRAVFLAHDLLEIVNGTEGKPEAPTGTAEDKRPAWIKKDAKAMFILSSSMDYSQLDYLVTCTSANAMWTKLSTIHEQKSASNTLALTTKFHDYRMAPGDSAAQHMAKIENIANQLKDINAPVSDIMIIAKILSTLPSKFGPFVSAWDSVATANQTLDNLRDRILREEARMTTMDDMSNALATTSISGHDSARGDHRFNNNSNGNLQNGDQRKKDKICFFCKKSGHIAKRCLLKKRLNTSKNASKNTDKVSNGDKNNGNSNSANFSAFVVHEKSKNTVASVLISSCDSAWFRESDEGAFWILDSGASRHICCRRDWFEELTPLRDEFVYLGDETKASVEGRGRIFIKRLVNGVWLDGVINDALYVPSLKKNLLSTGVCTSNGCTVSFNHDVATICSNDGNVMAQGIKQPNNLMRLLIKSGVRIEANYTANASLKLWHERLGHANTKSIRKMINNDVATGLALTNKIDFFCENCPLGKLAKLPFKKIETKKSITPGEVIHSDLCGPMETPSVGGAKYFLLFKDESSGFRSVYFLKNKSDTFDALKSFVIDTKNKFREEIKILRTDNGTEYTNGIVANFLKERGIKLMTSAPYTPEQNGRAEREMRTIVECARTMLLTRNLQKSLWAEAVNTAVYVLNRTLGSRSDTATPFELWSNKKPDVSHLRQFGCPAYPFVPSIFRRKWDPKSKANQIFVGYEHNSGNYRIFDPNTSRISVTRNVIFNEELRHTTAEDGVWISIDEVSPEEHAREQGNNQAARDDVERGEVQNDGADVEEIDQDRESEAEDGIDIPQPENNRAPPRRHVAAEIEPRVLRPRELLRTPNRYAACVTFDDAPKNFKDAMNRSDSALWIRAIEKELDAHAKNNTWTVTELPTGRKPIGFKWVFKIKNENRGNSELYKARLCGQGFSQVEGIDYDEIFSPVVRFESVRILLAIAAKDDLKALQFDVSTAYLNSDLKENIYMRIPDGLEVNNPNLVLKLNKAIYGLKQAGRCWNEKFDTFIKRLGFTQCNADKCVYIGDFENNKVYLALYVDDGLLLSRSYDTLVKLTNIIKAEFDITAGALDSFVGMEIVRDNGSIFVHQSTYIDKILKKFKMDDANAVKIPADPHVRLTKPSDQPSLEVPYREAVGSLLFLAMISRPDIAYAVGVASRFLDNHDESHWQAVKRIFRYIKGTPNHGLLFKSDENFDALIGYSDADYAADLDTRRSTTGYIFTMTGGCIAWSSKRQACVSLSTTEAEFIAASEATKEAMWLRKLLSDIGHESVSPTLLFIDNQSAIKLTRNPEFHRRSKHIDVRYHFICEKLRENVIDTKYVSTNDQNADILTKALSFDKFKAFLDKMNVIEGVSKTLK